jgi:hypothetical protein
MGAAPVLLARRAGRPGRTDWFGTDPGRTDRGRTHWGRTDWGRTDSRR